MNRETLEETGVYLLSHSLPQHCLYTRISGLQKLKVNPPGGREGRRQGGVWVDGVSG